MAANIRWTRDRLSATAWGLLSSLSSHAGWVESMVAMYLGRLYARMSRTPPRLNAAGANFERLELPMPELIYLNGKVLPLADATIGVEDRGFQFADGVYEVIRIYDGQPFTLNEHLDRLARSAGGIEIKLPLSIDELASAIRGVIDQSGTLQG